MSPGFITAEAAQGNVYCYMKCSYIYYANNVERDRKSENQSSIISQPTMEWEVKEINPYSCLQ